MLSIPGHKGNANQTILNLCLTPVKIATIKNTNHNKCWQSGEQGPSYTDGVNINEYNHCGNQYRDCSKN
jgi:hypothetical protein